MLTLRQEWPRVQDMQHSDRLSAWLLVLFFAGIGVLSMLYVFIIDSTRVRRAQEWAQRAAAYRAEMNPIARRATGPESPFRAPRQIATTEEKQAQDELTRRYEELRGRGRSLCAEREDLTPPMLFFGYRYRMAINKGTDSCHGSVLE
jgi:hypothetical protein